MSSPTLRCPAHQVSLYIQSQISHMPFQASTIVISHRKERYWSQHQAAIGGAKLRWSSYDACILSVLLAIYQERPLDAICIIIPTCY
jgi:hypothetical protein